MEEFKKCKVKFVDFYFFRYCSCWRYLRRASDSLSSLSLLRLGSEQSILSPFAPPSVTLHPLLITFAHHDCNLSTLRDPWGDGFRGVAPYFSHNPPSLLVGFMENFSGFSIDCRKVRNQVYLRGMYRIGRHPVYLVLLAHSVRLAL